MQRSNLQVMVRPRRLPEGAPRGPIKLDKYSNEIELLNNLFQYDVVFSEEADQEQVYDSLKNAVEKLVEGYCVGILAYGQTSSGKTYTIGTNGVEACYLANPGIISRAASDIFRLAVPRDLTTNITIKVTFMEIYNEQAFDLLHVDDKKKPIIKRVRDVPRKDRPGELVTDVEGLISEVVTSSAEVMEVLQKGSKNRRVAATSMNATSSRSHAVFTIFVEHLNDEGESTLASTPYLQLVDLAGSEVPEGDKATMKEGVNINKSLSALGRVIIQLRDRSGHVSYRDSVLTRVLKPLLDGNSITTLIACISMEASNEAESKKTLHYAQQARKIEISAQKAQRAITREEFLKLKDENRRLKDLCAKHNLELGNLEMTIMEMENDNDTPESAMKTEELIQFMLKYESASKRNDVLQERCNQLEQLVEMFSKKFDDSGRDTRTDPHDGTFVISPEDENADESLNGIAENPRNELELVSALSSLDKDYDEQSNQLKFFVEMQKKSKELQEKVTELEKQLVQSESEKTHTTKQMASSKTNPKDLVELQKKLDEQTEKNRSLHEKLGHLRRELKNSSVNSDTIEKYKSKVETINRERVKLQKMLKEQSKKSQEEMKKQKREMIALQRQQQKQAAERTKQDAKQAAERRCQHRKLQQALAARDRLEMLLKKQKENSKMRADKSKSGANSVFSRVKEFMDDELNMAATRALTQFFIDDYTRQSQAFGGRIDDIECQLKNEEVDDETRRELEAELKELRVKKESAQSVVDKNNADHKTSDSSKFHEKFTTLYEAQLAVKHAISKYEMAAYQSAGFKDELATLKEQYANSQQLLADCEHQKHLAEEKYAAFLLEAETNRDEDELERITAEMKAKDSMIDQLQSKLSSMSKGMLIPRSPFTGPTFRKAPLAAMSVAHKRLGAVIHSEYDTSTLFSEDDQSFADDENRDPDWTAGAKTMQKSSSSILGRRRGAMSSTRDEVEDDDTPPKKLQRSSSDAGCKCNGGGKSCVKCKCTKAGNFCSVLCKCSASCGNAPIDDDDTAQKLPTVISSMVKTIEGQKLY